MQQQDSPLRIRGSRIVAAVLPACRKRRLRVDSHLFASANANAKNELFVFVSFCEFVCENFSLFVREWFFGDSCGIHQIFQDFSEVYALRRPKKVVGGFSGFKGSGSCKAIRENSRILSESGRIFQDFQEVYDFGRSEKVVGGRRGLKESGP